MPVSWEWPSPVSYEGYLEMPAEDQRIVKDQLDRIKTRDAATSIALLGPVKAQPKKKKSGKVTVPPHAPLRARALEKGPQIGWPVIWADYATTLAKGAAKWSYREPNDVYDLIVQATTDSRVDNVSLGASMKLDVTPCDAMIAAQKLRESLSKGAKASTEEARWVWAGPCKGVIRLLGMLFDEDASANGGTISKAFAAGWRWFPSPAPASSSHKHVWYPPGEDVAAIKHSGITMRKDSRGWCMGTGNARTHLSSVLKKAGKDPSAKKKKKTAKKERKQKTSEASADTKKPTDASTAKAAKASKRKRKNGAKASPKAPLPPPSSPSSPPSRGQRRSSRHFAKKRKTR